MLCVNGIFFMSFKMRDEDYGKDGRTFTCFTTQALLDLIYENLSVNIIDVIETKDVREGRNTENWISIIIQNM